MDIYIVITFVLCLGFSGPPRKQLLFLLSLKFQASSRRFEFEVITKPLMFLQKFIQKASDLNTNPKTIKMAQFCSFNCENFFKTNSRWISMRRLLHSALCKLAKYIHLSNADSQIEKYLGDPSNLNGKWTFINCISPGTLPANPLGKASETIVTESFH